MSNHVEVIVNKAKPGGPTKANSWGSFTVRAGDTVPSRVYLKYLGVMLDPYLSWNDHIGYIGRKISAKLGMPS